MLDMRSLGKLSQLLDWRIWLLILISLGILGLLLARSVKRTFKASFKIFWTQIWYLLEPVIAGRIRWRKKSRRSRLRLYDLLIGLWLIAIIPIIESVRGLIYSTLIRRQSVQPVNTIEEAIKLHDSGKSIILLEPLGRKRIEHELRLAKDWKSSHPMQASLERLLAIRNQTAPILRKIYDEGIAALAPRIEQREFIYISQGCLIDKLMVSPWGKKYVLAASRQRYLPSIRIYGMMGKRETSPTFMRQMRHLVDTGIMSHLASQYDAYLTGVLSVFYPTNDNKMNANSSNRMGLSQLSGPFLLMVKLLGLSSSMWLGEVLVNLLFTWRSGKF